jgi:PknH-like extracellular domain
VWYTIGYPHVSEDISTVVSYREGGERLTEVRAIASRSNVVIDVDTEGIAMSGEQAAALVKAITDKIPH